MGLGRLLAKLTFLIGSNGATSAVVAQTPCWDWIRSQAPICWPGGDGSIAIVTLLGLVLGTIAPLGKTPRRLFGLTILWVFLGMAVFFLYDPISLRSFTVTAPILNAKQEIVGFGLYNRTLTEYAIDSIRANNMDQSKRRIRTSFDLVNAHAGWGRPEIISGVLWKPWAVNAAGASLTALFALASFLWAFAVGQLCRFIATPLGLELFPNDEQSSAVRSDASAAAT